MEIYFWISRIYQKVPLFFGKNLIFSEIRLNLQLNKEGSAKAPAPVQLPIPCDADQFEKGMQNGMVALDIRSAEAFAGAFIPDSLAILVDMVPAYAGWFLPYDRPVGIISDHFEDVQKAVRYLIRIGYDNIEGFL